MKMLLKTLVFCFISCGLITATQVVVAEERELSKDEVTALFSGKTATGNHPRKNRASTVYFAPDGAWKGKGMAGGKQVQNQGKWSVDGEGRLCMEKNGDTRCRRVVDDNGVIKKYKQDKLTWTYTKFEDGDQVK